MKRDIVVRVARDPSGHVFSEVWDKEAPRQHKCVVIDRQNGTRMNQATVISRAKSMSELTSFPYEEDLSWPCVAAQKLRCVCPLCVERGMA